MRVVGDELSAGERPTPFTIDLVGTSSHTEIVSTAGRRHPFGLPSSPPVCCQPAMSTLAMMCVGVTRTTISGGTALRFP